MRINIVNQNSIYKNNSSLDFHKQKILKPNTDKAKFLSPTDCVTFTCNYGKILRLPADSSKDWDKFVGKNIPSSLELNSIIFKYLKKSDNICDIGMGFGKTIFDLYRRGYTNLCGIDTNKSGIDFAIKTVDEFNMKGNFKFLNSSAENTNLESESQDVVITQAFWTTIINYTDRKNILNEINRILKNNGILYISDFGQTPNIPRYKQRYDLGIKNGYEKGTFEVINDKGELEYLAHHYTRDEFKKLLLEGKFSIKEYLVAPVQTRSGNNINGHIIIANKT